MRRYRYLNEFAINSQTIM